jgi:hypothetical protein
MMRFAGFYAFTALAAHLPVSVSRFTLPLAAASPRSLQATFSERHATIAVARQHMVAPRPAATAEDHRRSRVARCAAFGRLAKRSSAAGADSNRLAQLRQQIAAAHVRHKAALAQVYDFERTNDYFTPAGRQRWLGIVRAMAQAYHEMVELQWQLPLASRDEETKQVLLQSLQGINQDEKLKRCIMQFLFTREQVRKKPQLVFALHGLKSQN